ncbi:MAG: LysR family transcriptional regulator [Intestinibacter bartlettii]|uniref:LysR family transcriptional regulator n=1 Tax=Intestinibacter bartlettii TaxID=261299 RepID=UPI0026EAA897|nr:LysR family transcriptional regulator [Intestinibacter bartlettii]MDO5010483.1 LysR family transcriptional regulator [Intestinibacter bartlettii]
MDVKQLQYFVVSVDMGSFHSAAEVLITTQPNVSKIVKSLEEELNMTLLNRTRSGVTITPQGESIYTYAIEVLKNINIINEFKKGQEVDTLSISSVPSNTLSFYLSQFYNSQSKKDVRLDFFETNVQNIIRRVHGRKSELGFVYISKRSMSAFRQQVKSKGLEYHELTKVPLYLFVGKNNPLYKKETIEETDLKDIKLIQYHEKQFSLYNHLGHIKEDIIYNGDSVSISYTNSDSFLTQSIKNTEYGSIASSFVKNQYQEYGIRAIPILACEKSISFGYIKRKKDGLSDLGESLISYLANLNEF